MGGLALYFGVQLGQAKTAVALARQQVLERDRMLFRQERARQQTPTDVVPATHYSADTVRVEPPPAAVFADELGSLTGEQLSELMKAGLPADPEAFLRTDLERNAQRLFPDAGRVSDVRILSPNAALVALAQDGGRVTALVQFRVTGSGAVAWRVAERNINAFADAP